MRRYDSRLGSVLMGAVMVFALRDLNENVVLGVILCVIILIGEIGRAHFDYKSRNLEEKLSTAKSVELDMAHKIIRIFGVEKINQMIHDDKSQRN